MKGVSRLRPAAPRYSLTWNPDKVLEYLKNLKTEKCNLKNITLKLVALLALSTGQRVQTLSLIKIKNIILGNPVQIIITDRLKTTTNVKSNPVLLLPPFHDSELCPVVTLKKYMYMTENVRMNNDQLFLSFSKPYKPVCSQTISKWLVKVLEISGIDSSKFHGHSYRHAATSKAAKMGINMDTILKRVGWTPSSKTFAKYYNRPFDNSVEFASTVLNVV